MNRKQKWLTAIMLLLADGSVLDASDRDIFRAFFILTMFAVNYAAFFFLFRSSKPEEKAP